MYYIQKPNYILMKKIVFSIVLIFFTISAFSQIDGPSVTLGVNSGLDHNFNAFQIKPNAEYNYTYYGINNQYNIGIDLGIGFTKKVRGRVELKYVNGSYGMNYENSSVANTFVKTIWNINNMDFNIRVDYLLCSVKKFEIFASPGLKYEFFTGQYIQTTLPNKSVTSRRFDIQLDEYPASILGGAMEILFKYNISKNIGVTLIPEYTYFFRNYVKTNDKAYSRFSANAGFEFKF